MHEKEINPNVSIIKVNVNEIKFTNSKDSFKLNEETTHTRSSYMPFIRQVTKVRAQKAERKQIKRYTKQS